MHIIIIEEMVMCWNKTPTLLYHYTMKLTNIIYFGTVFLKEHTDCWDEDVPIEKLHHQFSLSLRNVYHYAIANKYDLDVSKMPFYTRLREIALLFVLSTSSSEIAAQYRFGSKN